jgi:5-methylcytosine-specific restriction endonuclease McrA
MYPALHLGRNKCWGTRYPMPTAEQVLRGLLPVCGVKIVAPNDKSKSAYCLNEDQVAVMTAAGVEPQHGAVFDVRLLREDSNVIEASYYHSQRGEEAGRTPEPRMGRAFISQWLEPGDRLFLGTDRATVFASKLRPEELDETEERELTNQVVNHLSTEALRRQAATAPRHPQQRTVQRQEFVRSLVIVELALRRANGRCEMPNCASDLFRTTAGEPYLEVHHIVPLSEQGEDVIGNVAALCPRCHRAQHYSAEREALRTQLQVAIRALP